MTLPEKPKVLIVEDDVELATTIELALQDPGIQIIKCYDGAEAIEIFEARQPQIVILDLMLPKRGGFYVLNRWKGHSTHKGKLPIVIMITGNEGKRHQDFAQSLGVDEYLRKPFALSCLVNLISKYLNELPYLTWVDKDKGSPSVALPPDPPDPPVLPGLTPKTTVPLKRESNQGKRNKIIRAIVVLVIIILVLLLLSKTLGAI